MNLSPEDVQSYLRRMAPRAVPAKELYRALAVPPDDRRSAKRLLRELADRGAIKRLKGARYIAVVPRQGARGTMRGVFRAHPKGYGFVTPCDAEQEEIYVAAAQTRGALHGDEVEVRLTLGKAGRRRSGEITRVVERAHHHVVGQFVREVRHGALLPFDRRISCDIEIPWKERGEAQDGDMVIAEVIEHPTATRPMRARVIEVLGDPDDPEVLAQLILYEHGVSQEFSGAVLEAAAACPKRLPAAEVKRRRDLRPWPCFTIDGENARDFDDAVSIRQLDDGAWELGVHIADVSWYVAEGAPLDLEAYDRATSIYLPDRAIPMLPEQLSTNLCSLRPENDRLTLSVIMQFDDQGALCNSEICESVIHSRARLTYTAVQHLFDGESASPLPSTAGNIPAEIHDDLFAMRLLAQRLRSRRMQAGSLDFDLPEADFVLDEEGRIVHVEATPAGEAHELIEEFMLAANQAVARRLRAEQIPLPYRIHEPPQTTKMAILGDVVTRFGYRFDIDPEAPNQYAMQALLDQVSGSPEARILNTLILRTMRQARYDIFNVGHFGLAFDLYTHFTSPIRRYPDLLVHRHVRRFLLGKEPAPEEARWHERLALAASHASERERRADRIEHAVNDLKTAAFMEARIGEEYDGFITELTTFGFFVELIDLFVEGLVHMKTLTDDYYTFDEEEYALIGTRTGRLFRLGDRVRIRVHKIDLHQRHIDFELVDVAYTKRRRGKSSKRIRRRR